ncbi:hypothetical protein [Clostridium cylindrosporum]|uniref:Uncharacterized protein n=1 Tax=Clostridium cylindrosporum DSM 605 TaxID=1121307 RepID=A0A0J8DA73_CLOCY|nr:hypothetical protein [Clostridium cylindrosporum]KMT22752.1 hypothetical protein CLCY_11c00860 [Clostridium cylindrosporum DSM 605]
MSRYYECDNILNNCCDKYKKKCHRSKKHKRRDDREYCNPAQYSYDTFGSYNQYSNSCSPSYNSGSYDNILVLLLIILLLCSSNCTPCCEE